MLGKAKRGEGERQRGQVPRNSQLFLERQGGEAGFLWRGEGVGRSKEASSAGLGREGMGMAASPWKPGAGAPRGPGVY